MLFDMLYVLAKGGLNVYSGRPQHLRSHLNECNIYCNENQIPIEILMKLSANGANDENAIESSSKRQTKSSAVITTKYSVNSVSLGMAYPLKAKTFHYLICGTY